MNEESESPSARASYLIESAINELGTPLGSIDKINTLLGEAQKLLSKPVSSRTKSNGKFEPPCLDAVLLNGAKIGLPQNECIKFHSYYEANGWKVGRNGMKSWHAAMIHWRSNWQERTGPGSGVRQPVGGSYRTIADDAVRQINNFHSPQ